MIATKDNLYTKYKELCKRYINVRPTFLYVERMKTYTILLLWWFLYIFRYLYILLDFLLFVWRTFMYLGRFCTFFFVKEFYADWWWPCPFNVKIFEKLSQAEEQNKREERKITRKYIIDSHKKNRLFYLEKLSLSLYKKRKRKEL